MWVLCSVFCCHTQTKYQIDWQYSSSKLILGVDYLIFNLFLSTEHCIQTILNTNAPQTWDSFVCELNHNRVILMNSIVFCISNFIFDKWVDQQCTKNLACFFSINYFVFVCFFHDNGYWIKALKIFNLVKFIIVVVFFKFKTIDYSDEQSAA